MIDALLNLWITRLYARPNRGLPSDPDDFGPATQEIVKSLNALPGAKQPRRHVAIMSSKVQESRASTLEALRYLAHRGMGWGHGESIVTAWLIVNVPVASSMSPTSLIHRMVRRLYFAAVLHGLGELPVLREAVVALRQSYLQSRGTVSLADESSRAAKSGAEVGLSLSLTNPLSVKLTASEEVAMVEKVAAQLPRADLFEAEDQLIADLRMLSQLEMLVTHNAKLYKRKMPRWEQVRSLFKNMYEPLRQVEHIELRPVFVLEAGSAAASVTLMRFLSNACGLASNFEASLVLCGGPTLAALWQADQLCGQAVTRGFFNDHVANMGLKMNRQLHSRLLRVQVQYKQRNESLPVEVATALEQAIVTADPNAPAPG